MDATFRAIDMACLCPSTGIIQVGSTASVRCTLKSQFLPAVAARHSRSQKHGRRRGSQVQKSLHVRASKATEPLGQDSNTAGPWVVKNDFDDEYVLVSDDPDEVQKEINRMEMENEVLRKKVEDLNKFAASEAKGRQENIDKSRPRLGAVPPSAPGEVMSEAKVATAVMEAVSEIDGRRDVLENARLSRPENQDVSKKALSPISVIFVSSEAAPYSKTGGLADVVGSLPVSLASRGHRVMVVSPRYMNGVTDKLYAKAVDMDCRIKLPVFHGEHEVAFFHEFRDGVDWVFVDHPSYHRPGNPYGDTRGTFGDNQFRFTLLSLAACEAPLVLPLGGFTYGEKCLFVANDWHAGLVPVYLAAKYRPFGVHMGSRCILAIHNLAHQGVEPGVTYGNLGLPGDWYGALEWIFPEWQRAHELDKGEAVNIMKGAIVTADRILTVSQGYAWEIQTAEGGWGLDGLLRSRNFVVNGITNGIDIDDWNPASDRWIDTQFSVEDMSGKAACKKALQMELGLPIRADVPLIGFIGRLDYQKGPDIIQAGLPELMTDDVQMVMLGSGDPVIESWMAWAEKSYHDKFRGWAGFSIPVAHRITAGCDILLMPSRFEPCGLNQLYAMRYGTIPVAHSTGGLRDTIEDFNPFGNNGEGRGTGWTFSPLSKEAMMSALWNSILTYREYKPTWKGLMKRGMSQDFSWERAALQYEQVFAWAMLDPPYA
eukprot:TRINITY_DN344_c0_g1_i1.p1 TRINITY_DN344_c0_g1~~TRINITY_DN344_c0_g1_i1.p1  ORF type:complete len:711 (+),score=138.83 TRINITY_DN344_c0_g1_i1:151-2283(+)